MKMFANCIRLTYGDVVPRIGQNRWLSGSRQTGVCSPVGPEAFGLCEQVCVETNQQPVAL